MNPRVSSTTETMNYDRMQKWSASALGPVFFNHNLFVKNGIPLKFYLHGYDVRKFLSLSRIIEAYGGKSSTPEAPDTIVFCKKNCCPSAGEYDCYNDQYFQDSIVALQSQELEDYKLHSLTNERPWRFTNNDESLHLNIKPEKTCKYKLLVTVDRLPSPVDHEKSRGSVCNEENNNNVKKNGIDDAVSDESPKLFLDVDHLNESDSQDMSEGEQSHQHSDDDSMKIEDGSRDSSSENGEESDGSEVEAIDHQEEDDSMDVDRDGSEMHSDDDSTKIEEDSRDSSSEDGEDSDGSEVEDIDDSMDVEGDGSQNSPPKSRKSRVTKFTEEEDEKILAWVIKKNVIPQDFARHIWKDMLEEKVLENRCLTPSILSRHFRMELKLSPTFKNFIENFKGVRKYRVFWTEEEDQMLMKYLIDNNSIPDTFSREKSKQLWSSCLEANTLSFHPSRTLRTIRNRFRYHLRHNYEQFTDDPHVREKFKELEQQQSRNVR